MKLKVAICDDEQLQMEYIKSLVVKWSKQYHHICDISTFFSAEAFLFEYEEDKSFDILLLDIEMNGISGIDLAKKIRQDNYRAEIIFITSHFEFCGEGYEVDALHYLMKPVEQDKLFSVLTKAAEKLVAQPLSVIIASDGEIVKLYEDDILYVEAMLHYLYIVTREKKYKVKEKISSFEAKLSDVFYRSHRSYLISLKHIIKISRTSIMVTNGAELPLARGKYNDIHYAFIAHN